MQFPRINAVAVFKLAVKHDFLQRLGKCVS
jgi:hypothetical protein